MSSSYFSLCASKKSKQKKDALVSEFRVTRNGRGDRTSCAVGSLLPSTFICFQEVLVNGRENFYRGR